LAISLSTRRVGGDTHLRQPGVHGGLPQRLDSAPLALPLRGSASAGTRTCGSPVSTEASPSASTLPHSRCLCGALPRRGHAPAAARCPRRPPPAPRLAAHHHYPTRAASAGLCLGGSVPASRPAAAGRRRRRGARRAAGALSDFAATDLNSKATWFGIQ
jgi:hypothetical protein